MAETSVILFELLHGWNRVNIDYMTNMTSFTRMPSRSERKVKRLGKRTDLDLYHLNGDQSVSLHDLDHSALGRFGPSSFVF